MIAFLRGELVAAGDGFVVVDVGGVGYRVFVSQLAQARLGTPGARVSLRVHTEVSQESIRLFGFLDEIEQQVFECLISMNGLGPKTAMQMISGLEARELAAAVGSADVARLCTVPGVGRKTAERLIVNLKEKLQPLARGAAEGAGAGTLEDLRSALANLGFRGSDVERALAGLRERALSGEALDLLLPEALRLMRG